MRKFELTEGTVFDLTIENKLYIKGGSWEDTYSIKEVCADRLVITQNNKIYSDILYVSDLIEKYKFEIFVLDKEKEPEYWL